jgi:hypothetical protein
MFGKLLKYHQQNFKNFMVVEESITNFFFTGRRIRKKIASFAIRFSCRNNALLKGRNLYRFYSKCCCPTPLQQPIPEEVFQIVAQASESTGFLLKLFNANIFVLNNFLNRICQNMAFCHFCLKN